MLGGMDLAVAGPMARSAEDLDLALDVLAGPTDDEATGWNLALPRPRHADLRSFRVAAWLDDADCPVDTQVGDVLRETVEALRAAGVRVDETARPFGSLRDVVELYSRLLWAAMISGYPPEIFDALARHAEANPDDRSGFGRMARYGTQRFRDWAGANEARAQLRARVNAFFRDFDVLLTPVNPVVAIPHDHSEPFHARVIRVNGAERPYFDLLPWIAPATLCYLPASAAPVGRTRAGLPVGMQIVGPYLEDRTPIEFARRLGELRGGFAPPPGY